jgi:hypothetical protein
VAARSPVMGRVGPLVRNADMEDGRYSASEADSPAFVRDVLASDTRDLVVAVAIEPVHLVDVQAPTTATLNQT